MQEPPKVVDLMEALRRSLDAVSTEKKKPAKAVIKKTEAKASGKRREEAQSVVVSAFLVRRSREARRRKADLPT